MGPRALLIKGYKASKKKTMKGLMELLIAPPTVVKQLCNHKMKKTYQAVPQKKTTILATIYRYQPHREI